MATADALDAIHDMIEKAVRARAAQFEMLLGECVAYTPVQLRHRIVLVADPPRSYTPVGVACLLPPGYLWKRRLARGEVGPEWITEAEATARAELLIDGR